MCHKTKPNQTKYLTSRHKITLNGLARSKNQWTNLITQNKLNLTNSNCTKYLSFVLMETRQYILENISSEVFTTSVGTNLGVKMKSACAT